ncbi:MAG TPA: PadR family transcriptional regulator [Candidatus Faecalicoccus intestinipullorum]|nr:PadR family transcriptional regulator [Candidatus Faecalicoccus intestinipullorum]
MDAQLKRGFLEFCVLASIKNKDSYGYQIVKDVSQYIEISESTLYPILRRLESSQSVMTYTEEHKNRLRKYYRITDKGKESIQLFLDEWKEIQSIYEYIKGEMDHE